MPKRISGKDTATILSAVEKHPGGASWVDIEKALRRKISPRTLQFRLRSLVNAGRLVVEGESRAVRYRVAAAVLVEGARDAATVCFRPQMAWINKRPTPRSFLVRGYFGLDGPPPFFLDARILECSHSHEC